MKKGWFCGKKVLITGAGSGIGRELAIKSASRYGCKILAVGRDPQKLEALRQYIPDVKCFVADVGIRENWEKLRDFADKEQIMPDIIINNAGIIHPFRKLIYLTDEEIERIIDVDFKSVIYSFKTFYDVLARSDAAGFITISSASAYLPVAGNSVYSSVKSASKSLTEALRQETYKDKIYVAAVMPGPVVTDLYMPDEGESEFKAGEDVSQTGISASKAADRIIAGIRRKKPLINIDAAGKLMKFMRAHFPAITVRLWAKLMRKVNRPTFAKVFKDESKDISE